MNDTQPTASTSETDRVSMHELQPDELVSGFNRSPIVLYGVLALVFHLVIIGALSVPTLMAWAGVGDKPETQLADDADGAKADEAGKGQPEKNPNGAAAQEPKAGDETASNTQGQSNENKESDPNSIEARKNTDVYKEATEATAKPPKNPDEGIDDELFRTDNDL